MSHVPQEISFFSSATADWFVAFVLGHNHKELAAFFCPSVTCRKQLQLAAPRSPVIITDVVEGGRGRGPEFLKWFTPFLDALPFTGWRPNYEIKVISKIVIGRDMEVPELWSELKRALINQSYSSPLMWLEDIPEAAIWAASVPHPNIPFGSLVLLSLPRLPSIQSYNSQLCTSCNCGSMYWADWGRGEITVASVVNIL